MIEKFQKMLFIPLMALFLGGFFLTAQASAQTGDTETAPPLSASQTGGNVITERLLGEPEKVIEETALEIDRNYQKRKLLPDSKLYFLKNWKENAILFFLRGRTKDNYMFKLSQERLLECALLLKEKDEAKLFKTLTKYGQLVEKINKEKLADRYDALKRNFLIINGIYVVTRNAGSYSEESKDAVTRIASETSALYHGIALDHIYRIDKSVTEIRGALVYNEKFPASAAGGNNPFPLAYLLVEYEDKILLISPSGGLKIADQSGAEINNLNNIKPGQLLDISLDENGIIYTLDDLWKYKISEHLVDGRARASKIAVVKQ